MVCSDEVKAVLENVRVLTHSAIRVQSAARTVVYIDPYNLADDPHDADAVLLTHTHYDHFSPNDASRVMRAGSLMVAPASAEEEVRPFAGDALRLVRAGESAQVGDVRIEAVPAYNVAPDRRGFHPQGSEWVGYVLVVDGVRLFVTGDTDQNADNERVMCDVVLLPVGGTYTCDAAEAAAFANALRPQVAVPTHYGSVVGSPADAEAFAQAVDPAIEVVLKMERL